MMQRSAGTQSPTVTKLLVSLYHQEKHLDLDLTGESTYTRQQLIIPLLDHWFIRGASQTKRKELQDIKVQW